MHEVSLGLLTQASALCHGKHRPEAHAPVCICTVVDIVHMQDDVLFLLASFPQPAFLSVLPVWLCPSMVEASHR